MAHALDWSVARAEELAALAQPPPTTNTTTSAAPITLQIGDPRFITTESTLKDSSPYFAAFFSGRWTHTKLDGAYFIDEDGDSFEHVLRYLRHKVRPLFWDRTNGFDRQKYSALKVSAEFFGVESLSDWIKKERFTSVVKVSTVTSFAVLDKDSRSIREEADGNTKVSYLRHWSTRTQYHCPVYSYHDGPSSCGCKNEKNVRVITSSEGGPVLHVVTIREETTFNWEILKE